VEHVEVKNGLIRTGRLPRSRHFVWIDPNKRHDIIVFIGEAQPPLGKYAFCHKLIEYARELGVEQVFTFAAMATQMRPEQDSGVFGAATDDEGLEELRRLELELVQDGNIGGLNGVLLGVAAEVGLRGTCLLGEMPHIFAHLPYPKASLVVLQVFAKMVAIELDLSELSEQAQAMEEELGELFARVERAMHEEMVSENEGRDEEPFQSQEQGLSSEDEQRIERLFKQAAQVRSKAYELKRVLDQLEVFPEYEDRFLDLFKKRE
jgi:proteasome assembly chaperone (PAC2) family protein